MTETNRKLCFTSYKDMDFGIIDYKNESVRDPDTKRHSWQLIPRFDIVKPVKRSKKFSGQLNGHPFTATQYSYIFDEKEVNKTIDYHTGEALSWEKAIELLFKSGGFIPQMIVMNDCKIKFLIGEDCDKSTIDKLLKDGHITMDNVSNSQEYVESKEGVILKKAEDLLKQAAGALTAAKSENESKVADIAKSEALKEFEAELAPNPAYDPDDVPID